MPTITEVLPADYSTTWVSGGLTMTVNTRLADYNGDKTSAAADHKAKVEALLVEFPKDA